MSDIGLRQDVIDALEFEPSLDAANIGVAVDGGVVTLTGHVATYLEKVRAEEVTRRIKGVRAIAQEIEVRPFGTHQAADDEIARRVLSTLQWTTTVPWEAIQVKVSKGWVTLTGTVDWHYQREDAQRAIRKLAGVRGISNDIALAPRVLQGDVRGRIEKALRREAELEASRITVEVTDGTVTLEGKVHSWIERNLAEAAAWAAPGVQRVKDRLTVA